jgi:lysophospholipase
VDPDPGGLQKVEQWLIDNKGALAGYIIAMIVVIAGVVGFM